MNLVIHETIKILFREFEIGEYWKKRFLVLKKLTLMFRNLWALVDFFCQILTDFRPLVYRTRMGT